MFLKHMLVWKEKKVQQQQKKGIKQFRKQIYVYSMWFNCGVTFIQFSFSTDIIMNQH